MRGLEGEIKLCLGHLPSLFPVVLLPFLTSRTSFHAGPRILLLLASSCPTQTYNDLDQPGLEHLAWNCLQLLFLQLRQTSMAYLSKGN